MSFDGDAHEGRRNAVIAAAVAVLSAAVVGSMFWLMSSVRGPVFAVAAVFGATTATTPSPTAASGTWTGATASTSTPPETSVSVPSIATWTPTTTFRLPPPEQPTLTAPVPGQTADPAPDNLSPGGQALAAPQPPAVTNLTLICSKGDGGGVTAKLTFRATTTVDAAVFAGGTLQRKQGGPGDVSMTASGRGPKVCIAKVGDQTIGPIPPS